MACGCGASGRQSFSDIVKKDGSSLPTLKYLHCKYQDQFESLFAQLGITVNEVNLKLLAYASDTGNDVAGTIKHPQTGQPIYFSVENTINKIDKSKPVNNLCSL